MLSAKRYLSIILIVLLALLAIALVIWVFEKRLRSIELKQKTIAVILPNQNLLPRCLVHPL